MGAILSHCKKNLSSHHDVRFKCFTNLHVDYTSSWKKKKKKEPLKLDSRLPGEISITPDMQMTPPLWQKVKKN